MPRSRNEKSSPRIKKYYNIIEYLKENTDANHPVNKTKIMRALGDNTWKDKRSFNDAVFDLVTVVNSEYNLNPCIIENNGKIYYNHVLNDNEIIDIVDAIMLSKLIEPSKAKNLLEK